MNHDLLDPAHAIITWCDAIFAAASGVLTEKQTADIQRVQRCAGTFADLVVERAEEIARLRIGEANRPLLHELRNPLNCMIGYSDMMLTGFDGDLPEGVAPYLQQVFEVAHSINNTLDSFIAAATDDSE
ncbi:MAG: hypothetical protein H6672_03380 [Anaerolineaceae bacterium]|nr:hypothetical protein [Anaerolineaceae bacterium]